MGILDNEVANRNAIREKLHEIVSVDFEKLSRTQDLGRELGYEECIPLFERIVNLYKQIGSVLEMKDFSSDALNQIN